MKKIFIKENTYKDTSFAVSEVRRAAEDYGYVETAENDADLAVAIGGDGTFIDTAKMAINADIIGINKGTLGYLTETEENNSYQAIKNYVEGNCFIQKRMMLQCEIGGTEVVDSAINDIVVTKKDSSVIDVEISIDDKVITRYYADGIIISTPSGSTGYAFSCGAPIIDPSSEMILITPIAPHTIMNRSICASENSVVSIKLLNARQDNKCVVNVDGVKYEMAVGSAIKITKAKQYLNMVKFDNPESFFERIMSKMGIPK